MPEASEHQSARAEAEPAFPSFFPLAAPDLGQEEIDEYATGAYWLGELSGIAEASKRS